MFVALILVGAAVAFAIGYVTRRWWLVPAALALGAAIIAVDLSTRDLMTGGHDDRLIVASVEVITLALLAAAIAAGIVLAERINGPRPGPRPPHA